MSNIIDILVVADGETIANTAKGGPTKENPTPLGKYDLKNCIYMVCNREFLNTKTQWGDTEATNYLAINANVQDVVRWRGCSVSKNDGWKVSMIGLTCIGTPNVLSPAEDLPFGEWDNILQATVMRSGTETYDLVFELFSNDSTSMGFYTWDPYINVTY